MPSGALTKLTGRNQVSVEATNSAFGSARTGAEGHAVGLDGHPVDQVVGDLAEEELAAIRRRVGVAAVDGHAAGGREVARADQLAARHRLADGGPAPGPELAPGLGRADPEQRDRVARLGRVVQGAGSRQVGVPRQVPGGQDDVLRPGCGCRRGSGCPSRRTCCRTAHLPRSPRTAPSPGRTGSRGGGYPTPGVIAAVGAADLAAVARPGAVDPVVEAPLQVVHHRLDVVLAEPGEDPALDVGPVVAVGVAEVPDVGRRGDEDAPLPDGDAGRPGELVGEDVALVERAVAVAVDQQADTADRRVARVLGERLVVGRIRREDSRVISTT